MKKPSSEIIIAKEVSPVVADAQKLVINDEKSMHASAEMLSRLNILNDRITYEKESITSPAKLIISNENKRWAPIEKPVKEAIALIREKQSDYQTQETKRVRAEENRIADRIGEGKGKIKVETAIRKMGEVEKPVGKIVAESGELRFREDKILKIVDKSLVPIEYLVVDEKKALDALKSGIVVAGCEIDIKMVPINSR